MLLDRPPSFTPSPENQPIGKTEVDNMRFTVAGLKPFVVLTFVVTLIFFFLTKSAEDHALVLAYPDGAPTGTSGAPNENDCTDCHNQSTLTGQFQLILPSNYVPGQTYQITVQHTTADASRARWGFQLAALTAANAAAGTFANTTSFTQTSQSGGRRYVDQTTSGTFRNQTGGASWSFNWTAPSTDVGPVTFYSSGLQANNNGGDSGDQTYVVSQAVSPAVAAPAHQFADFDGDGKSDPAVYRPGDRTWYLLMSSSGFAAAQWGIPSDKLTPADFDGDDITDIAVWRPGAAGEAAFYILESGTGTVRVELFGMTGDDPMVVGDWDGDGKADPAVYRDSAAGSQSYFYYRGSLNNPGSNIAYLPWGATGDIAMRGDFDGDDRQDTAVFRPSNRVWYVRQSSNSQMRLFWWGVPSDKFVSGDFDGDGKSDPAVFRDGTWYILRSSDSGVTYINWGVNGDVLAPADYDGDGKTDAAVFRANEGLWFIQRSSNGVPLIFPFGVSSDKAVQAEFVK